MQLEARVFGDRFRAEHVIETTGSVITYDGWDIQDKRRVVLKVASGMARDRQLRLAYEAELLCRLKSPYIVALLAAGRDGDDYYVAMPRAGNHTLAERLQTGPLSVAEALTVGIGLLRALEAVHSLGLFHRDLKPENILLDESLTKAVLIDFGFAVETGPAGSLAYMAPERLGLLHRPSDERSDLYEAGLVLYEALAGRPPFQASDARDRLRAQMAQAPPGLCGTRPEIPPILEAVVFRLLEIDPARRYQRASSAAHDLEALLAGQTPVVGATDLRQHLAEPVLVGREAELKALESSLREAMLGQVRLVRLVGASGSGKSRLLQELARRAQAMGVRVLSGRAQHDSAQLPFVQMGEVFRPVAKELAEQDQLREALRPWGEVLAIALESFRAIYSLTAPNNDSQPRIARAARRLLAGLEGPTVLLLDDCQWSNEAVFQLIEELLERKERIMIVAAFRDEMPEQRRLWTHQESTLIELSALSKSLTRMLLESMAGSLSAEVVDWVWATSGGEPFMAVSALHGLLESRALEAREDGWALAESVELKASVSRRGAVMLAQRLALLGQEAQAVLEAGAVVGRQFQPSSVAAMTGLTTDQVAESSEQARQRRLVWRSQDGLFYVFAHDRVREQLLGQLSAERVASLHLSLARYLQEWDQDRVFEVAYHLNQASRHEEALPYALQAAEQARGRQSFDVAEPYYRMAARGAGNAPLETQLSVAMGFGEVLISLGRYQEAERIYLQWRSVPTDRLRRADIESRLSLIYSATDPHKCKEAVFNGLRILGHALPERPLFSALWHVLVCRWQQLHPPIPEGQSEEADIVGRMFQALPMAVFEMGLPIQVWAMLAGVNHLERLPPSRHLGVLYGNLGAGCALAGAHRLAHYFSNRSLENQKQLGDAFGLGQGLSRWALPKLAVGRFGEVIEQSPTTLRLLEPVGDAWELGAFRLHRALAYYYRGELGMALDLAKESLLEARRDGDLLQLAAATRLSVTASLGRVGPAADLPIFKEKQSRSYHLSALGIERLYAGQPVQAVEPLFAAEKLIRLGIYTVSNSAWLVTAYRQSAEACPAEEAFRADEFLRLARKVIGRALSEGKRHTVSYPHALRESALLAAREGRQVRARKQLDRSVAAAQRHQMDYELAWSLCERGRIGTAFGWENADRDLGHGRSLLARLGAWLPGEKPPQEEPTPVLSVVDRFSKVLESGRRIASSLDAAEIRGLLTEAALGLLRCQDCRVVEAGDSEVSSELVVEAIQVGHTVLRDEGLPDDLSESLLLSGVRSALCSPVLVHGRVQCLLYVTHQQVGHLFGEEERRIGDYLASLAGAALENAHNFHERQKANERFETLFRWTGVGTAVVSQEGRISDANPFFEQMLGLSREGVLLDAIYHADRALVEEGWRRLFQDGQSVRLEVRCLRASGELLWAQLTASRPPGENSAIAAFSDVSDRRLTQVSAFQESERRLLAAELHDGISQPLAALYVHLQTAALEAKGKQADQLKDCVQQAKSMITELSQLMFDLRNPTSGDVDAVAAVSELCRGFAAETGISVDVESSGGQVHGLAGTFLYRLVQEALANVRKHSQGTRVELLIEVTDSEVACQIRDDGKGFDPSQVQCRTTRHFGLTGMKERAELLGGTWTLSSVPEKGTRIEFRLPLG